MTILTSEKAILQVNKVSDRATAQTNFPERGIRVVDNGVNSELAFCLDETERLYFASDLKLLDSGASLIGGVQAYEPSLPDSVGEAIASLYALSGGNHSALTNLSADDHTQYAKLDGRAGGQVYFGGTDASDTLHFQASSNSTQGSITFGLDNGIELNGAGKASIGPGGFTTALDYQVQLNGETLITGAFGDTTASTPWNGADFLVIDPNLPATGISIITSGATATNSLVFGHDTFGVSDGRIEYNFESVSSNNYMAFTINGGERLRLFKTSIEGVVDTLFLNPTGSVSTFDFTNNTGEASVAYDTATNALMLTANSVNSFTVYGTGIATISGATINEFSTDGTLSGNSDLAIPTEKAVKTYVDAQGGGGVTDHGALTGLTDDDHLGYARLSGRAGGQTLYGGTGASDNLRIYSTSSATKGTVYIGTGLDAELEVSSIYVGMTVGGTSVFTALSDGIALSNGSTINSFYDGTLTERSDYVPTSGAVYRAIIAGAQDLSDYAYLPGTLGGQTLYGDTASGGTLTLRGTSSVGFGNVVLGLTTQAAIQVAEDANEIYFYVSGTQRMFLDSSGMMLQTGATVNEFSTDGTLAGNSDTAVPTEKAVKTYVDSLPSGSGDVVGPVSSVDNRVVTFDGVTGKAIQDSGILISSLLTGTTTNNIIPRGNGTGYVDSGMTDDGSSIDINRGSIRVGTGALSSRIDFNSSASGFSAIWFDSFNGNLTYDNSTGLMSFVTGGTLGMSVSSSGITLATGATVNEFSTDGTLSGNSDTAVPTEKAVKAYVDALAPGAGDVVGPASAVSGNIVSFDGTTGKLVQDSGVAISSLLAGTITTNTIAKGGGAGLVDSSITDTGTAITLNQPVLGVGNTGNANSRIEIRTSGTGSGNIWFDDFNGAITYDKPTTAMSFVANGALNFSVLSGGIKALSGATINEFSTDGTLAGDSDTAIPTEKAIKTYVDNAVGGAGIGGSGTTGYLSKWDSTSSITNSVIYDDSGHLGINIGSSTTAMTIQDIDIGVSDTIVKIQNNALNSLINFRDLAGNQTWGVGINVNEDHCLSFAYDTASPSLSSDNLMVLTTGGNLGLNTFSPSRRIEALDGTNPQLRLSYSDADYVDFQCNSNGDLIVLPYSDLIIGDSNDSHALVIKGKVDGVSSIFFDNTSSGGEIVFWHAAERFNINALSVDISASLTTDSLTFTSGSGAIVDLFSTDGTLAGNSDTTVPTEKAIKTYVDAQGGGGVTAHSALTGLGNDDHTQYLLLAGRSGGQVFYGGTASGDELEISSTSNGTKGTIHIGDYVNGIVVDEVNNLVNIGVVSTLGTLNVLDSIYITDGNGVTRATPESDGDSFVIDTNKVGEGMTITSNSNSGNASIYFAKPASSSANKISCNMASDTVSITAGSTLGFSVSSSGISLNLGATINEISIDGTLAGDSDLAVPTEKAVKAYVDAQIGGGGIGGSGTAGKLALWTGTNTLGDSIIEDTGSIAGVGVAPTVGLLQVAGQIYVTDSLGTINKVPSTTADNLVIDPNESDIGISLITNNATFGSASINIGSSASATVASIKYDFFDQQMAFGVGGQGQVFNIFTSGIKLGFGSTATVNEFSTDGTLSGDSDTAVPTEKAVKTYVDSQSGGASLTIVELRQAYLVAYSTAYKELTYSGNSITNIDIWEDSGKTLKLFSKVLGYVTDKLTTITTTKETTGEVLTKTLVYSGDKVSNVTEVIS